ncbi:MAG: VTT domain-containing protein [Bryobacterales bacterium]|nr:VTT domain-containing protein [Bryobacterales bacterium]
MIDALLEFVRTLTNPEKLIHLLSEVLGGPLGYLMLIAVVFAETGLLMGFFLPGDSLLFTVGVVAGAGHLDIVLINLVLMAAAVIGDGVGYYLGYKTGPAIFSRPDSRLFKQEYLRKTQAFYAKHGGKTIIYARFVPIVRTFAPFIAGVGKMEYRRFLSFNIFGGIGWVFSMTMLGYGLGNVPIVRAHFEKVILGIIFVSVAPVVVEFLRSRGK